MAFATNPKPEPRAKMKARLDRQHDILRAAARRMAWERDGRRCVECGKPLYLNPSDEGADWYNVANINEIRPRSLGGSDIDLANLNTKCAGCHTGKGYHAR